MSSNKPVIAAATVSLVLVVLAGNAQESPEREAQPPHSMNQMPMQMMHECMRHCQAMSSSMREVQSAVEQARESRDPDQMRSALDQVHEHMSGMQEKMDGCMQMMQDHDRMDH